MWFIRVVQQWMVAFFDITVGFVRLLLQLIWESVVLLVPSFVRPSMNFVWLGNWVFRQLM
ncbi:hypothetical protein LINGRAHAP2_LOCUS31643 [Linum grandiflorum]